MQEDYVKYIPANHNLEGDSKTSNHDYKKVRGDIASNISKLINPDFLAILKEHNLKLRDVIPFSYNMIHNNIDNVVYKSNPTLWQKISVLKNINGAKNSINSYIIKSINNMDYESIIGKILDNTDKTDIEELTEQEIQDNVPLDIQNEFTSLTHLKRWFENYIDDYDKRSGKALRDKNQHEIQFMQKEKPPWVLMNEILAKYEFKYRIKDIDAGVSPLVIQFYNVEDNNIIVPVNDLSSGEQQLITLVAWAHHEIIANNIRLLLLDEPDSHLHPSFCRIFVEIINEYVVKQHEIQVIMTTHSPSTIAYAPEESIYVMNEQGADKRIEKQGKNEALSILSDGLMTLTEANNIISQIDNTKEIIVFVEGESDIPHLESAYDKLEFDLDIQFIKGFGAKKLSLFMRGCPNLFESKIIIGLFDNDEEANKNLSELGSEWATHGGNEFVKKSSHSNRYIVQLPILDDHSVFGSNCIELMYPKDILLKFDMIKKALLSEVNPLIGKQMNDKDYTNNDELKYYKLKATKRQKFDFADSSKEFDKTDFNNFICIFDIIKHIKENNKNN